MSIAREGGVLSTVGLTDDPNETDMSGGDSDAPR